MKTPRRANRQSQSANGCFPTARASGSPEGQLSGVRMVRQLPRDRQGGACGRALGPGAPGGQERTGAPTGTPGVLPTEPEARWGGEQIPGRDGEGGPGAPEGEEMGRGAAPPGLCRTDRDP